MKTQSGLVLFLQENLQRLFTKSPLFFKIWTYISLALVLVTGVPDLINWLGDAVVIPDLWNVKITAAVAWSSRAALFMSLLTTQSTSVAVTEGGVAVKMTDAKALPFTAASEQKKVDTEVLPTIQTI
jgi:hypothetical protein